MRRRVAWPAWAVIALAGLLAAWLGSRGDLGARLEYELADAGSRLLLHRVQSDVVIIGIDARSLAELDEWPWPRRYHARLIDILAPASPAHLFFDIDFSSPSNAEDDRLLESALARWEGNPVVLPVFHQFATPADPDLVLSKPLPRLLPHVSLAPVSLRPSADGLVRGIPAGFDPRRALPGSSTGTLVGPAGNEVRLDYTIDPASFNYFSFSDVLANRVPAEYFADKTVFVGATAVELGDNLAVPLHRSLPGVTVLALALESASDGTHELPHPVLYWLIVAGWTALLAFLFCRLSWRRNVAATLVSLLLADAAGLVLYTLFNIVLEVVPLLLGAMAAYLLATLRSLESETLRAVAYAMGLRKRDALLKSIVVSSTDCIVCMDDSGTIKTANPAAARLFFCDAAALANAPISRFIPGLLPEGEETAAVVLERISGTVFDHTAHRADGEEFPVEISISRVKLKEEQLYTAIVRDISERKAQHRQLQFQATHDPLTTLPNRPALAARLDSLLAAAEPDEPVALLMLDLDRFKEVNDTLGHNVGDYVLHEVARRLEQVVGNRGFIARIGGDEFALVVERFDGTESISAMSQELVDCMKKPVDTCGVAIDVGLSIGIALYPLDAQDSQSLFKNADVAMYVAKRSGSGFEYYNAAADRHSIRKLTTVTRLRQAITAGELQLNFQPQVNLVSGQVESVEALLRWDDTTLGRVAPDEFVALAETTDLIQPLTEWTLRRAFAESVSWQEQGYDLRIAINLSARMLQDVAFPTQLASMMREAGVQPRSFELEITESAMMFDPNRALSVIKRLDALGVMISIDDYGTGYSSLAYLRDLPVHAVKLDKSFVMNMQHHDDRVIVESTVQLAHALKLKVIAEGVETAADAAFLKACGYDYGQGYFYSVALDPDALLKWIRRYDADTVTGYRRRNAVRQLSLH